MNTITQNVTKLLLLAIFLLAAMHFSACSKDENPVSPAPVDNISGSWKGPFFHPAYYSGSLEMTVTQNDNTIIGTFHLYLSPGYSGEDYYGTVSGSASNDKSYTLSLINTDFTWICSLTLKSDSLAGDWESARKTVGGSLSVGKK